MRKASPRPLTLIDVMVLVAAVAAGLALQRWVEAPPGPQRRMPLAFGFSTDDAFGTASMLRPSNWFDALWLRQSSYIEFTMAAALVVLRWRGPRPRARRILRQPGAVACLAVVAAMSVGYVTGLVMLSWRSEDFFDFPLFLTARGMAWNWAVRWAAPAVAGAWAALVLQRRWSPERSWLDFAGRLLGWYWLLGVILAQVLWPFLDYYLPLNQDPHR